MAPALKPLFIEPNECIYYEGDYAEDGYFINLIKILYLFISFFY